MTTEKRVCPGCSARTAWKTRRLSAQATDTPDVLLSECAECALVGMELDLPSEARETYISRFLEMIEHSYAAKSDAKALRVYEERADLLRRLSPGRMLDVGSERGYFLDAMRKLGWSVEGVEPHGPHAEFARSAFGLPVTHARLEDARVAGGYDLITMWHVLEHVDSPLDVLRRCRELLEPGGLLFLEVPNLDSLGASLCGSYWLAFRDPTHRWAFRQRAIAQLAERAGFEIERIAPAWSRANWYGIKRGLKASITRNDYWKSKIEGKHGGASWWREGLSSLVGFYPLPVALALLGGVARKGEILRVWCRRPKANAGRSR
jgi:2-polyprenyl-3-methyl-5-hydroxy-6-metoxy-1,4-benzoquinol methylase